MFFSLGKKCAHIYTPSYATFDFGAVLGPLPPIIYRLPVKTSHPEVVEISGRFKVEQGDVPQFIGHIITDIGTYRMDW